MNHRDIANRQIKNLVNNSYMVLSTTVLYQNDSLTISLSVCKHVAIYRYKILYHDDDIDNYIIRTIILWIIRIKTIVRLKSS